TLNKILVVVGIFSLMFAILLGTYMARRLTKPIASVIDTAQMISDGFLQARITEKTDTKEIVQLTETINELANTLQQQDALRKRLTTDMAHELRTPLTTLQSHLEAMLDGIWAMDAERLASCHEEAVRINRMVSDLERLAKIENDNVSLDITQFDIGVLIKRTIQNFESEFYRKNIQIAFKEATLLISADQDKISQVMVNLISNALKYTEDGGAVTVSLVSDAHNVFIKVADTGIGISQQDLPYIFERFYRADRSRNRQTGGCGIGLAIVKSIVQAHHGYIDVQSELQKGTTFTVTLAI
ncbi:MAG: HAMP domain-containing protein, partial [Hyphomonadaceae bacterium]|nr:HAMP domain-containing protein [Clostridia bacterium]